MCLHIELGQCYKYYSPHTLCPDTQIQVHKTSQRGTHKLVGEWNQLLCTF